MTTQIAVNDQNTNSNILAIFESRLQDIAPGKSLKAYRKAINALASFCNKNPDAPVIGSREFLEDWIIHLFFSGLSQKTTIQYYNILSALHNAAAEKDLIAPSPEYPVVKARLQSLASDTWSSGIPETIAEAFKDKIQRLYFSKGNPDVLTDFVVFSLLNPALNPSGILKLTKDSPLDSFQGESRQIILRNIQPRHKYIFNFSQSKLTPNQIRLLAEEKIAGFLSRNAIPMYGDAWETLKSYWLSEAVKLSSNYRALHLLTGPLPNAYPIFYLLSDNSPEQLSLPSGDLVNTVAAHLLHNPRRWFVARLKRGKKYSQFLEAAKTNQSLSEDIELFNPVDRIPLRKDGKLRIRKVPVLGSHFMVKATKPEFENLLSENFYYISPCRTRLSSGSKFIEVSDAAMQVFQIALGQFTDDMEIGPAGSLQLNPGDKVVVIGGSLSGYEGEFIKASIQKKGVVYRIRIFGDSNDIEWRFKDLRLIEKLP